MPTPPLPASPCLRVGVSGTASGGTTWGTRFYLSYSGSAPTGDNCATLAGDVFTAWGSDIAQWYHGNWSLTLVDVLDIATTSGFSGQQTGAQVGTRSGTPMSANDATNIEYGIERRYRGGKPRMYLPPLVEADLVTVQAWDPTTVNDVASSVAELFAYIAGLSIGSLGTLAHVNLSYYDGYNTNIPPWRGPGFKYPPKYRALAQLDTITGYFGKSLVSSQRRRRSSTTP